MVQLLTPEQSKAIVKFLWEAFDKLIWLGLGYLGVRIHQIVKNIRPGIVEDVVAAVMLQTTAQLTRHAEDDRRDFGRLETLVHTEAESTRAEIQSTRSEVHAEIHAAIQTHVKHMHMGNAHGD